MVQSRLERGLLTGYIPDRGRRRRRVKEAGEVKLHRGSDTGLTLKEHLALVELDERSGDHETQSGAGH